MGKKPIVHVVLPNRDANYKNTEPDVHGPFMV